MGRLLAREDRNIPATMVMCRFLILEPEGPRAKKNQALLQRLLNGNVKRNANGSTEIRVDASMVRDSTDTVHVANDFRDEEVVWSVSKGLPMANELAKLLEQSGLSGTVTVQNSTSASDLNGKLDLLCGLLLDGRANNYGFLWEYHADWLIAVKDAGHTEAVAYLAYASTDDKEVKDWLKENGEKIGAYYEWEKDYSVGVLKEKH
jgi:hypothetical protein